MRIAVIVRARFKAATAEEGRSAHDAIFTREAVTNFQLAGNFSHRAFVSAEDQREILAFDLWDRPTLAEVTAFYQTPAFQEAAAATVERVHEMRFYVDEGWARF
jgi:quinol monooxygenase YgiN